MLVQGFIIHILQVRKLKLREFKWICPGPHTSLITELRCIQRWYDPCFVYQHILLFCDTPAKLVQCIVQNTNLVSNITLYCDHLYKAVLPAAVWTLQVFICKYGMPRPISLSALRPGLSPMPDTLVFISAESMTLWMHIHWISLPSALPIV